MGKNKNNPSELSVYQKNIINKNNIIKNGYIKCNNNNIIIFK